jgi:hypothetical protein
MLMKTIKLATLLFYLGLLMFTSCTTAKPDPSAITGKYIAYETKVDNSFVLTYELPITHGGFTPEPKPDISARLGKFELLAGYSYPSGWFDRVVFSAMFRVGLFKRPVQLNSLITAEAYTALKQKESVASREESISKNVRSIEEQAEHQTIQKGKIWWSCSNGMAISEPSKIRSRVCVRPIFGATHTYDVIFRVDFGKPVAPSSSDFAKGLAELEDLMSRSHANTQMVRP